MPAHPNPALGAELSGTLGCVISQWLMTLSGEDNRRGAGDTQAVVLPKEDGGAGQPRGCAQCGTPPIAPFKGMAFASVAGASGFPPTHLPLGKSQAWWLLPWLG